MSCPCLLYILHTGVVWGIRVPGFTEEAEPTINTTSTTSVSNISTSLLRGGNHDGHVGMIRHSRDYATRAHTLRSAVITAEVEEAERLRLLREDDEDVGGRDEGVWITRKQRKRKKVS